MARPARGSSKDKARRSVPTAKQLETVQSFWNVRVAAFNWSPPRVTEWTKEQLDKVDDQAIKIAVSDLVNAGCNATVLVVFFLLLPIADRLLQLWRKAVGNAREREQTMRSLNKAAEALQKLDNLLRSEPDGVLSSDALQLGQTSLKLRAYVSYLSVGTDMVQETAAQSPPEIAKYLLTAYVQGTTGALHDREVSALIGGATDDQDYAENAHKAWRRRRYANLDISLNKLARFITALAQFLPPTK